MSTPRSAVTSSFLRKNLLLWNVTNFRMTNSPYYIARFTIPGLSHESFDSYGNAKVTSIMTTSVTSRGYALLKPDNITGNTFLDWPSLTKDKYTFISSTEYKMAPELYNADVPKWPLDVRFSLGNVGNCSISSVTEFFAHGEDKVPLWTNVTQSVAVDMATRKPTPLPDWFTNKYKGKGCMEKGFIVKGFDRPPVTFNYPLQVKWSDTDNYEHTNFASYVRFAIDALHAAVNAETKYDSPQGSYLNKDPPAAGDSGSSNKHAGSGVGNTSVTALKDITNEKIANGLKNVQICYLSESLEGQTLNAHIWQTAGQENVVFCSIERDSAEICQIALEYFDTGIRSNGV